MIDDFTQSPNAYKLLLVTIYHQKQAIISPLYHKWGIYIIGENSSQLPHQLSTQLSRQGGSPHEPELSKHNHMISRFCKALNIFNFLLPNADIVPIPFLVLRQGDAPVITTL
jgi:hypothetical protein